ncbi:ankyrin repeat domain-containing protein 29 isoform X7 [Elephas maximus indicus]|uniref:ankyrin repeat domain-containing protein 29 isoform X7 n=1 Tax=Elephas maximus indicus TaxID=99487 RepID=UPI002116E123|nr:ankyrin repeat domain-containing protein 29 isoform X7 [Elephas maximus indicus]
MRIQGARTCRVTPYNVKETPLANAAFWAARRGNVALLKLLLNSGRVDVDCRDSVWTGSARHYAPHGRLLCWSPELCAGAGSTGSRHQSPERGWSHCTLPGCPRWLLGCHSITLVFRSKSQPAKDGTAPLWIASQMGHSEVVRVMLLRGAERDAARNDGTTALLKAANKGYSDVIEELLKFSPTLGILKNGTSALHAAVLSGNIKTVALLLEAGADPALRNKANELPAELTTNERILRLLRSKEPHRKS